MIAAVEAIDQSPVDTLTESLPEPERSRVRAVMKMRYARIMRLAQCPKEMREAEVMRNFLPVEAGK